MTEREHGRGEGREPLDEEAAWAQIIAGYGEEPADPPGWDKPSKPDKPATDKQADEQAAEQAEQPDSQDERDDEPGGGLAVADPAPGSTGDQLEAASDGEEPARGQQHESGTERTEGEGPDAGDGSGREGPLNDADQPVRSFTVYAAGTGPRDFTLTEPDEEDDHFVPPEPPPLPQLDPTAKFAWLAVLGGPALLFSAVIFQIEINWWMITLGIGGFLGGFGTLASRLRDGRDDEDEDPGRGAVV